MNSLKEERDLACYIFAMKVSPYDAVVSNHVEDHQSSGSQARMLRKAEISDADGKIGYREAIP
jgi:hypothetical protein